MTVKFEGKQCVVAFVFIGPEDCSLDEAMCRIDECSIAEGKKIPEDCQVQVLALASAEAVTELPQPDARKS